MEWVASTLHTTSEHGVSITGQLKCDGTRAETRGVRISGITATDSHTSAVSSRLN